MGDFEVIVVGAGPGGVATSACLNLENVSNMVVERDDCCGSTWKKKAYDRLKLHLAKSYCQLPHMPFPEDAPTYVPKSDFVRYLDDYADTFGVNPRFHSEVDSAYFDTTVSKWTVVVRDVLSGVYEVFSARFLVVATGENSLGFVPRFPGFEGFRGTAVHSSQYRNGKGYAGENVLVVGCGNSGMEIAYDLSNSDAKTSIVARSPVHLLSKDIVKTGMFLLKFLPIKLVDKIAMIMGKFKHGNVSEYGFQTPKIGPFALKAATGRSPTIDVGTVAKIKSGEIKVFPSILSFDGNNVNFDNGETRYFDAIVFATGYQSTVKNWLKGGNDLFNENGMPRRRVQNENWKGQNGLYSAGFSSRGLLGISQDAKNIAQDIAKLVASNKIPKY